MEISLCPLCSFGLKHYEIDKTLTTSVRQRTILENALGKENSEVLK